MQTISNYASTTFQRENQLCVQPRIKIIGKQAFFQSQSPNSATSALPGRDFIIESIQAEFGLPSVRDLGERILPLKSQVAKNTSIAVPSFQHLTVFFFLSKSLSIYFWAVLC